MPGNPNVGSADLNARRIVAYGLRNPFRITVRPGTNEIWVGDVGWNTWEEINRIPSPTAGRRTSAGPATRAPPGRARYDSAQPERLREPVQRGQRGRRRRRTTRTTTRPRSSPARPARPAARRSPGWRSTPGGSSTRPRTTARCSSPTTAATASGSMLARRQRRCPTPRRGRRSSRPRPARWTSQIGPGRRPLLRRHRRRHDPAGPLHQHATSRRPPSRPRRPTTAPRR